MNTTQLRTYFYGLSANERERFATNCGTTPGQLIQIINKNRRCLAELAIKIDRESNGRVSCDELCPTADFDYLRSQVEQIVAV